MLTVGNVVLGVAEPQRAAEFWTRALGYVRREPRYEDDWVVVEPADGRPGIPIGLDLSESPVEPYPRVHLDFDVQDGDLAAEVQRLVQLGAQRVDWDRYPEDPHPAQRPYVVLADTEGNRFCVVGTAGDERLSP